MPHYKYERLSSQDNDFLLWEKDSLPMHGGTTQIFDLGPLGTKEGGVDIATIKQGIAEILHKIPRYREKLAWIPNSDRAIWVDDPHFNLDYHIRHTSLPRPGSDEQLKQLAARVSQRPLDRLRPLWEIWVVEGLEGDCFATISKTHHCMVDGSGGVDLAKNLYSLTPDCEVPEAHRYIPRPTPSDIELRRDDRWRTLSLPLRAMGGVRDFVLGTDDVAGELVERARALGGMAMFKVVPASDTPLNGPVGPHRIVDWMDLSLADLEAIRRKLGCSINDVVLGIVTTAVREFLLDRQVRPEDLEFRVATPVNVRPKQAEGQLGNHVSTWILALPLDEPDPLKQVARIHEKTSELKTSHQSAAIEMVEALHEWIPIDIQSLSSGTQNLYVTNVPGPDSPLYLLGAELREIFVQAPLIENLGLTIAVLSYNGRACFGFNADSDRIPDLRSFSATVRGAFERLAESAGVRIEGQRPLEIATHSASEAARPVVVDPTDAKPGPVTV